MARKDAPLIDFSNAKMKKMFIEYAKTLEGIHAVDISKVRDQRTLKQLAYYFGVVVQHVIGGLEEAWGERLSTARAHEFLKDKFLADPVVNYHTGEIKGKTFPSTSDLDTKGMAEYIDKIIRFAAEDLGVEIPWPNEYREQQPAEASV